MRKTHRGVALLASLVAGLFISSLASPVSATPALKTGFIRSFPKLPAFNTPTQQQIADLAQRMLDPNADAGDNPGITSGFTYFGQFIDHDLTFDPAPPPTAPLDPTTITNERSFALDLDSMYGKGQQGSPQLYDAKGKFLLTDSNVNGVADYQRTDTGAAIIYEPRNDENRIIAQIQLAMMKAHNRLIDEGLSFTDARKTLVSAYQLAIVNDFLPHILSKSINLGQVLRLSPRNTGTPVEFAVAAYRFGHSQVRRAYVINEQSGKVQVFSATAPDLRGGSPLPANRVIDWGEFFSDIPITDTDGNPINVGRRIDTLISSGLFVLPIPGAEATGSNVLAFRNMSRAVFYDMPSGQSVAASLKLPVITPESLNLGPGFETGTPLWYYILAESEQKENGERVGPTGSTIIAAGFAAAAVNGVASTPGRVRLIQLGELAGQDHRMTVSDLFVFAGVAKR